MFCLCGLPGETEAIDGMGWGIPGREKWRRARDERSEQRGEASLFNSSTTTSSTINIDIVSSYIYIVGRPGLLVVSPSVGHSQSHISVTKITPRCGCQIVLLVSRKTVSPDTSIQTLVYNIPLDDLIIHLYHHHHHHPLLTSGLDGVTHTRSSPLTLDPRPPTPT